MRKNYFLKSENIFLKPIEKKELLELADLISGWVNDEEVTYYMFTGQFPKNSEQVFSYFNKDLNKESNALFLIIDAKTKKIIGYAGLHDIHQTAKKAEFRILIGEKDFWGKGCGTEVAKMLTFYGFDRLNLNRIYLGFTAQNEGAGKAYERAGYLKEGVLREDIYRNSQYYDTIRMGILREEYYKNYYHNDKKNFSLNERKKI